MRTRVDPDGRVATHGIAAWYGSHDLAVCAASACATPGYDSGLYLIDSVGVVAHAGSMLMPLVSVTVLGLLVGSLASLALRPASPRRLLRGVVGAWGGFVVLALIGVTVDVITGNGVWVAILGHVGAVVGAYLGATWERDRTTVVRT